MAERSAAARALALIALVAGSAPSGREQAASAPVRQTPPQPTFRTGVVIVPVDVRVLDRNGRPVTDLSKEDFTVLEDGAPQQIRHFSARGLVPVPVPADTKPSVRTRASSPLQEQSARIFLIVLGRGRLQHPSRGVDAMIHFVRHRLLPQDRVAVLAFNRATDFTTDRARTIGVLERYKRRHEDIESQFRQRQSGLAGIYGSRDPSSSMQRDIDAIFRGPEGQPARQVVPADGAERLKAEDAARRTADTLARAELAAARPASTAAPSPTSASRSRPP